jgi:hypothetical protein
MKSQATHRKLLQAFHSSLLFRHFCSDWGTVLALEIVTHLLHGYPFHPFVFVDMLNDPRTSVSTYTHAIRELTAHA